MMEQQEQTRDAATLVLGIGNTLLTDEGAGVHALRCLAEEYPALADVELMDGGTLSFTLAGPIEETSRLIVIDAAQLGAEAGAVRVFEGVDMDHFVGHNKKSSVHEVGLVDLMTVALLAGRMPSRRALIGIQPENLDWGLEPTAAVQRGIREACAHAVQLIQRWKQCADSTISA